MNQSTESVDSIHLARSRHAVEQRDQGWYVGGSVDHDRQAAIASLPFGARPMAARSTSLGSMFRRFQGLRPTLARSMSTRWEHMQEDSEAISLAEYDADPKMADKNVIRWNGDDDPDNPLNWSKGRKWVATLLVGAFAFLSPFASTMVTPALDTIGTQFHLEPGFARQLVMSIFLFGFAIGPFTLAPLSAIYGRVRVLQYTNLIFLAFNTAVPFAKTSQQLYLFRALSGIGASAPQALGNGVLADCWRKEERGKGQAIYGLLTFLSPCVAPIMGTFIVDSLFWGWIFWITSLVNVAVQLLAFFFLRETYPLKILGDRVKRLRRETGNQDLRSEYEDPNGGQKRRRMVLPFIMMFTHPAVIVPSLYRAVLYGIMYLVLATFEEVWTATYHMTQKIASLHYIALAIGFVVGLQTSHLLMDRLYTVLKHRHHVEEGPPEWRIPPMIIGGVVAPVGLILYGWTAQNRLFWVVPDVGVAIFAYGLIVSFQSAQAYVTDAYGSIDGPSAAAVGAFMRTMAGFGFPLFAPAMYDALGYGVANTVLGGSAFVLMILGPALMWFYGAKMRAWSTMGMTE